MFVIQLCFGSVIQLYHFGIVEKQKGHLLWTRTCVQCCGPELFVSQLTLQTKKFRPRLKPIAGPVMTARIGTRWANLATKPESPAAKPVGFWAVWKSDVCSLRQTSDQASTVSRSSRTTWVSSEVAWKDGQKPIFRTIHWPSILALWISWGCYWICRQIDG